MDSGYLVVAANDRNYIVAEAVECAVFVTKNDTQVISVKLDAGIALTTKRSLHTNELTHCLRVRRLLPHKTGSTLNNDC